MFKELRENPYTLKMLYMSIAFFLMFIALGTLESLTIGIFAHFRLTSLGQLCLACKYLSFCLSEVFLSPQIYILFSKPKKHILFFISAFLINIFTLIFFNLYYCSEQIDNDVIFYDNFYCQETFIYIVAIFLSIVDGIFSSILWLMKGIY